MPVQLYQLTTMSRFDTVNQTLVIHLC